MQGSHKEGEYRQLEFWTWKSNVRPPILHNSKWAETSQRIFIDYLINIGANKYQRGPTPWPRGWGRALPPWARPLPRGPPGGPSVPIFCYMKSFVWEKKHTQAFGTRLRRHEAEPWRNQSRAPTKLFCRGNFPPGGGNHRHHHHQQLSHLGEGNLHQHLQQHHLLSNPSSSLVFNLCTGTSDWYLWVTSSVDYNL